MKTSARFAAAIMSFMCHVALLGGCSNSHGTVQTKEFSLADVKSIMVDYDGESATVKESDSDKIRVVEYIDKTKKSYLAKMDLLGGMLTISEGARPIGNGVHGDLEVYLPGTFQGDISLHTTRGQILSDVSLTLRNFRADTANGEIEISNLSAGKIELKSTGGKLTAKNLSAQICTVDTTNADTYLDSTAGMIEYKSKGGDLILAEGSGYGNFQATGDGSLEVTFTEVTGDIFAHTKNGNIALALPDSLNFSFTATAQDGIIQTSFPESLSVTDKTSGGTIGDNADVKIALETKNGAINVTR